MKKKTSMKKKPRKHPMKRTINEIKFRRTPETRRENVRE